MIMFMPEMHSHSNINKLIKRIVKSKIVKGVYPGYNMDDDQPLVLIHGANGWNLFTNTNMDEKIICQSLNYILHNKRPLLFLMRNAWVYDIWFIRKDLTKRIKKI